MSWDAEYEHLKWGGLSDISWIQNQLKDGSFLLDAGSGEGRYLRELCFKYSCIGIDLSKNAVLRSAEAIRKKAEKKDSSAFSFSEQIVSNVSALPFKNEIFDGVLCLGVLQHLKKEDREKTAAEFYRVLKTGGLVFFEAFGEEDMRCRGTPAALERVEPLTFVRQNGILYHYFKESEIKNLFEKAGLKTIEMNALKKEKKYGGETYVRHHYRAVFKKI